jgi:hypothetical protein
LSKLLNSEIVNNCLLVPWPIVKASLDSLLNFLLKRKVVLKESNDRFMKQKVSVFNVAASIAVNNYSVSNQLTDVLLTIMS